jgi:ClpP class serine protease
MVETTTTPGGDTASAAGLRRFLPKRWRSPRAVVPVLRLTGVISSSGPLRAGLNMARVAGAIERAFSTRHAKAVALVINSPGGAPAQSHLIMRRIRAFSEEKKVPVIAFVEDVAASGGYMIACAADEIIADPLRSSARSASFPPRSASTA